MIPNVTRGGDMAGLVRYLSGPGRHEEHVAPRVIAGSDEVLALVGAGGLDRGRARELARVLDGPHRRWGTTAPVAVKDRESGERTGTRDGHVWHCSLAVPAGEELSDAQWARVGGRVVEQMGWKDSVRWALVRHGLSRAGNDHAHLVVDLVKVDGRVANVHRDQPKAQAACARVARELGLVEVAGQRRHLERDEHRRRQAAATASKTTAAAASAAEASASATPEASPAAPAPATEIAAAARDTSPTPRALAGRRERLAAALHDAADVAGDVEELRGELAKRSIECRLTTHDAGGRVDGLVVWERQPEDHGKRRRPRPAIERAGQLDPRLAWRRLTARLARNAAERPLRRAREARDTAAAALSAAQGAREALAARPNPIVPAAAPGALRELQRLLERYERVSRQRQALGPLARTQRKQLDLELAALERRTIGLWHSAGGRGELADIRRALPAAVAHEHEHQTALELADADVDRLARALTEKTTILDAFEAKRLAAIASPHPPALRRPAPPNASPGSALSPPRRQPQKGQGRGR